MSNTFPAGFKSPGHSLCDCGVFILSLPGVIDLNHNQCLRCQVTSQNPTVNTERHKSPISHCSWTAVPASSLLTLPYKLELRGFPLPLLLKGLFPGCPHFPFLDALLPVMMVYFWPAVAFFFFFFFLKDFQLIFLYHLVSEKPLNLDDFSHFSSLLLWVSQSAEYHGDAQIRQNEYHCWWAPFPCWEAPVCHQACPAPGWQSLTWHCITPCPPMGIPDALKASLSDTLSVTWTKGSRSSDEEDFRLIFKSKQIFSVLWEYRGCFRS